MEQTGLIMDKYISKSHLLSKWQPMIAILAMAAILLYILFEYFIPELANLPLLFIIILGGAPICLQITTKLLKGDLGADSIALIAVITAVILNQYLAATLLILMLAGGSTLEKFATAKASSALLALMQRMPSTAHCKYNNQIKDIPLEKIKIGDIIAIYPHETCPVDGIVIQGRGKMDESYLTGEPYVISKTPGSNVLSGAINGETLLTIKATKLTSDSRYADIIKVLKHAEEKKPNIRRLADKLGAIFAPLALLTACLAWFFTNDSMRFLAVLVVATPCPLLIAIPITIISAISMAAKQSIIIKEPAILEVLPTCKTAIFDKTGTLTYGKPNITKIDLSKNFTENYVLQMVASLEKYSKHPLAAPVLNKALDTNIKILEVEELSELPGQGLTGNINGHFVQITSRKNLKDTNFAAYNQLPAIESGLECVVLIDNNYAATIFFRDTPRLASKPFIEHLLPSHKFNKVMLLSGDKESEVEYLGKLLNIKEIYASQTPEQKLNIVKKEQENAPTLFMGDGINDAPALSQATVGIAFGQYSNVTSQAADAVIMDHELEKVDELIHLSLKTRQIALQCAVGGMGLSLIGMIFAILGYITPVTGAIFQEIIDLLAIFNALRLVWSRKISIDF